MKLVIPPIPPIFHYDSWRRVWWPPCQIHSSGRRKSWAVVADDDDDIHSPERSFFFSSRNSTSSESRKRQTTDWGISTIFFWRTDDYCLKEKEKKNLKTWNVGTTQWSMVLNIFSNVVYCLFVPLLTFANLFPIRFLTDSLDVVSLNRLFSGCIRAMRL